MRVSTKNKIIEVLRIKYLDTSAYSPLLIKYRSSSLKSWCYSITGWRMMGLVLLTLSKRDNSFCTIYEPNCARFLRPQAFVLSEWPVSTTFLLHEISDAKLYTAHCFVLETSRPCFMVYTIRRQCQQRGCQKHETVHAVWCESPTREPFRDCWTNRTFDCNLYTKHWCSNALGEVLRLLLCILIVRMWSS